MRTAIVLGAAALAVSGCALLPAPVQIASLTLDGVSFVVSKKSVADHVISIAMQQDCALWRGVTEGRLCYPDGAPTMIAETEDAGGQAVAEVDAPAGIIDDSREPLALASLESVPEAPGRTETPKPPGFALAAGGVGIPGPYLMIEPEAAPGPDTPSVLVMRVRIKI